MPAARISKQSGFTFIELMVVIAIIGILAAITIPEYSNYLTSTEAMGVVQAMHQSVESASAAQALALSHHSQTVQRQVQAPGGYRIVTAPPDITPTVTSTSITATPPKSVSTTLKTKVVDALTATFSPTNRGAKNNDSGLAIIRFSCAASGACTVTVSQKES